MSHRRQYIKQNVSVIICKDFYSAEAKKSCPDHRTPKELEAECCHTLSVGDDRQIKGKWRIWAGKK